MVYIYNALQIMQIQNKKKKKKILNLLLTFMFLMTLFFCVLVGLDSWLVLHVISNWGTKNQAFWHMINGFSILMMFGKKARFPSSSLVSTYCGSITCCRVCLSVCMQLMSLVRMSLSIGVSTFKALVLRGL